MRNQVRRTSRETARNPIFPTSKDKTFILPSFGGLSPTILILPFLCASSVSWFPLRFSGLGGHDPWGGSPDWERPPRMTVPAKNSPLRQEGAGGGFEAEAIGEKFRAEDEGVDAGGKGCGSGFSMKHFNVHLTRKTKPVTDLDGRSLRIYEIRCECDT